MTSKPKPKPTDWHRKPKGKYNQPCAICGCEFPYLTTIEHRKSGEGFERRRRTRTGFKIEPLTPSRTRRAEPVYMEIGRAVALLAAGCTEKQAAEKLSMDERSMRELRQRYGEVWETLLAQAMTRMVEITRAQAGTSEVMADPDAYLARAVAADRWCQKNGQELFPTAGMTLTRFYAEHFKPIRLGDARKSTLDGHRVYLRRWRLLTGDPPIEQISNATLAAFRDALLAMRPDRIHRMSANTVRTVMSFIQTLLDKCGQPGPRNRDAVGLLERVPWVKPPRKTWSIPRIATDEQLALAYAASASMEYPALPGVKPPSWWKAMLVFSLNTALRWSTIFAMSPAWIDWTRAIVTIPPDQIKNRRSLSLPLNAVTMEHLQRIRTDRARLFEWPGHKRTFSVHLHRLQDFAAIPHDQHFTLHDLRRSAATKLWRVDPAAARLVLGHGSFETTINHYVDGAKIIADAFEKIEQPKWGQQPGNAGQEGGQS